MLVALWVAAFFIPRGSFGVGEFRSSNNLALQVIINQQQAQFLSFVCQLEIHVFSDQ